MALPLWEECAWVKTIARTNVHKFSIEKDSEDSRRLAKEVEIALKLKEEQEAEAYRKQIEQNERLSKLTSALLAPATRSAFLDESPNEGITADNNTPIATSATSSKKPSLFDDETPAVPRRKKSLFDEDEDLSSRKLKSSTATNERGEEAVIVSEEVTETDQVAVQVPKEGEISEELTVDQPSEPEPETVQFVFPIDEEINRKIFLYLGPGYKLPCDALVVGQNEALSDRNDDNGAIVVLGGPRLEEQLSQAAPIQTGEATITEGGALPANWVIHAVGPRYDERYLTAAEHALFSAYKASLVLALETQAKDVVISCIYSPKKKYPRFEAAHIALRTVRKFLQHPSVKDCFKRIMFAVPSQEDYEIYSSLLTAYFPRNDHELIDSLNLLPKELGDEWGEIKLVDRELKVSAGPKPLDQHEIMEYRRAAHSHEGKRRGSLQREENHPNDNHNDNEGEEEEESYEEFPSTSLSSSSSKRTGNRPIVPVGEKPKGMMTITHDEDEIRKARVARELSKLSREERLKLRFQALLEEVDEEDLADMEKYHFLEFIGNDEAGRTIALFIVANAGSVPEEDEDRVLLYIMKQMEAFRCRPFVLVFAYSGLTDSNSPSVDFMMTVFDLFAARYQENMIRFYVLHATFLARMYLWTSVPVLSNQYWKGFQCASTISELGAYLPVNNLNWPRIVFQHDQYNT